MDFDYLFKNCREMYRYEVKHLVSSDFGLVCLLLFSMSLNIIYFVVGERAILLSVFHGVIFIVNLVNMVITIRRMIRVYKQYKSFNVEYERLKNDCSEEKTEL